MSMFNHNDTGGTINAEQFCADDPNKWPKGVEETNAFSTSLPVYVIMTPDGEVSIEDGDYIIMSGDSVPRPVPYDEFMEQYSPVPDDAFSDDEAAS